ncbi:MAG: phosphopantetheine-binding protein, partial [Blastocatellia bacterium]
EGGIEGEIRGIWEELLGIEGIGEEESFFELGGDSLLVIQLISRLREAFKVEVQVSSLFDNPTIAGLAEHIDKLLIEEVENLSEEEAVRLL